MGPSGPNSLSCASRDETSAKNRTAKEPPQPYMDHRHKRMCLRLPMLHPFSRVRLAYETLLFVTVVASGFSVPVSVAWAPALADPWKFFFLALSAYFMLDSALNFRLGYVLSYTSVALRAKQGPHAVVAGVEMDPHKVARHYMRTWFVPDLLGSLPYDLIGWHSDTPLHGLKLLALLRLFKVMRLNRLQSIFKWQPKGWRMHARQVAITVIWMCLFCHLSACIFYWVGRLQPANPDGAWIYAVTVVTQDGEAVPVSEANGWQQYLTSLYYSFVTMTTTGFGDIHPGNTVPERVWGIVQVAVCVFVLRYIAANIVSLILEANAKAHAALVRGTALREFFEAQAAAPDWLVQRIVRHFDRKWRAREREALLAEIDEKLPRNLRLELFVEWWMVKVMPTRLLPPNRIFLRSLLSHAVLHDVPPLETILEQGSRRGTGHLYIVVAGIVSCTRQPGMGRGGIRRQNNTHARGSRNHTGGGGSSLGKERGRPGGFSVTLEQLPAWLFPHALPVVGEPPGAGCALVLQTLPIGMEEEEEDQEEEKEEEVANEDEKGALNSSEEGMQFFPMVQGPSVPPGGPSLQGHRGGNAPASTSQRLVNLREADDMGDQGEGTARTITESDSCRRGLQGVASAKPASTGSLVAALEGRVREGLGSVGEEGPGIHAVADAPAGPRGDSGGIMMNRVDSSGSLPGSDCSLSAPEMWEVAEGGLLGDACLYDLLTTLDVRRAFVPQLREWEVGSRHRSMFSAQTRTPVRLSVVALEDVLETMDAFRWLFVPAVLAMQGRLQEDRR
eukprot:jgi/Mesvir1/9883/Mv22413-RA.1